MKRYLVILPLLLMIVSCKSKDDNSSKSYISIVSLVNRQVKAVDSNFAVTLRKITIRDSAHSDTTVISREQFHEEAKAFLDIPDLSLKKIARKYKEETPSYDNMMNRVIFSYTALDPDMVYKSQQMLVIPDNATGDKVVNIIAVSESVQNGALVRKNLLWQMDKSFQISSSTIRNGVVENITTTKVVWSEGE